jgi:branched-chain amino acid transport system ATP-binding protein
MLAIGRALLGNPNLLIKDEPSEGLAPAVIDTLIDTVKKLEEDGLAILLIEQKLDVATSVADRQLVMVGGEIALETTAAELGADSEMQRRFLGVEPVARA